MTAPRRRTVLVAAPVALLVVAAVVLVAVLRGGGDAPVRAAATPRPAAAPAAPAVALATTSPAGAVQMPAPMMQMEQGMAMSGPACTATPTAAQTAAAVKLVDTSWADAKKYTDVAAAKKAGYRPITPVGLPVVHYINVANYLSTIRGGNVIAPAAPQSLVYANTPKGSVLVASMFIMSPFTNAATPPQPGGCLTQWHVHTNLCLSRAGVVALTPPACPAGSINRVTPPMLHVWYAPIPGGPTAVDAPDAQVVAAAEKVPGLSRTTA